MNEEAPKARQLALENDQLLCLPQSGQFHCPVSRSLGINVSLAFCMNIDVGGGILSSFYTYGADLTHFARAEEGFGSVASHGSSRVHDSIEQLLAGWISLDVCIYS